LIFHTTFIILFSIYNFFFSGSKNFSPSYCVEKEKTMARILTITSQGSVTDKLVEELKKKDKVLQVQLYRGASVQPPGDVIQVTLTSKQLGEIMRILDRYKLGQPDGISLSSSDPDGYIPTSPSVVLMRDTQESSWEEIEMTISKDSNTSLNIMIVMFFSGVITTLGLATNVIHIVIAGMLVAAGFMPISRIAVGLIAGYDTWKYGIIDFIKGYLLLMAGAAITTIILKNTGSNPLNGSAEYYVLTKQLSSYWTTITFPSILASFAAGIVGAVILATKKTIFASGVMIGLALIPSASIVGISAASAQWPTMMDAFVRFMTDVLIVFFCSVIIFAWVKYYSMKRNSAMRA
jgi:hypothetical protein